MNDTSIHSQRPHRAFYRLKHLLPGAAAMAGTAGFVNSVVLGFFHSPVSHMTGAVSRLGLDVADRGTRDIWTGVFIIVGFLSGATAAGLLVGARRLAPNRRFGIALMLEGLLLALAILLLRSGHRLGLPAAALACGLQNAIGSSYCGLQIRTTHVTGMVTDLGMMIGHWIRRQPVDRRKFTFFTAVFLAFGAGGYLGALADDRFGPYSLLLPSVGCMLAGFGYSLAVRKFNARILPPPPAPPPPKPT
ncbi:MAG: DUF1275 domain-containing protein [Planctomycetaceae bacterium]|nr:DUF1275 domain-containing protein [Planctomycetaceae bacterium]